MSPIMDENSLHVTQRTSTSGFELNTFSRAGLDLLKLASTQLKHQEIKSRVMLESNPKTSPLDQLASLVLHGHKCLQQLKIGTKVEKIGTKVEKIGTKVEKVGTKVEKIGTKVEKVGTKVEKVGTKPEKVGTKVEKIRTKAQKIRTKAQKIGTKAQNCRRIVVLGAPRVGKTSILRRFLREDFEDRYEPTCEDFHRKIYHIRGETYQIDILDASGERSFPAKRRLSILTGDIFLLVFSLDDRSSYEEMRALHAEILSAKSALNRSKHNECVPTIICANKLDLPWDQHMVSRMEVLRDFGKSCALFETSAKDSVNLEQMFEALARRGGLPLETGPSQHRKVSIKSYHALRAARQTDRGSKSAVFDAPCGALYPLARRPSFGTDLRLVLGPNGNGKQSKTLDKCQIQ